MAIDEVRIGLKDRLDDFIKLAGSGQPVRLDIKIYEDIVKRVTRSESTDDIDVETDMSLLMASFQDASGVPDGPDTVSKVYAIGPINESEVDAKTTRHVANQRLKMDYARLKEAGITFGEVYF
ncbi:hypothetical protein DSCA_40210 [Desulfosarcina alkanivorans]|jgi:hypothetical protein|uniref:Uncharacterized protein n=1 Tax=Desulfosarcina alkanivorans TaxID=571177 RepID=A0A5K7YSW3_9BACT|nr:hypothetical protein [Desulfosarcina alkanivorans]BBO70091.1 hypothetical protein DSCA_40210 [Desulfosarcina alkanivorans]